jgi:hypothetical protein
MYLVAILVTALAAGLEILLRSVAHVPYTPSAAGVLESGLYYAVASVPALLASRLAPRRRGTVSLLTALPFGLLALNLLLALAPGARPLVVALTVDAALCLGAAIVTLASRALLGAIVVGCLVVVAGLRWSAPSTAVAGMPGPSVLMVVLDTTAASHLSVYGYDRDTSPNLAALARRSLIYRRAISPASWTIPAHASIFSGRYPSQIGFQGFGFSAPDPGSIASDLARSGRPAFGISSNPLVPNQAVLQTGFDGLWSARRLTRPFARRFVEALGPREVPFPRANRSRAWRSTGSTGWHRAGGPGSSSSTTWSRTPRTILPARSASASPPASTRGAWRCRSTTTRAAAP